MHAYLKIHQKKEREKGGVYVKEEVEVQEEERKKE
jgi:hypothetical protein